MGAAILSVSFTAFPILLIRFGVLYPNLLSLCLMPATLGLTVAMFRIGSGCRIPWPTGIAAGLPAVGGVTLAHPNGLVSFSATMLLPILLAWALQASPYFSRQREGSKQPLVRRLAITCLAGVIVALMFRKLRPPTAGMVWGPVGTSSLALGEALTMSPLNSGILPVVGLLVIIGLYTLVRERCQGWSLIMTGVIFIFWELAVTLP
jgi:hypothetical protein